MLILRPAKKDRACQKPSESDITEVNTIRKAQNIMIKTIKKLLTASLIAAFMAAPLALAVGGSTANATCDGIANCVGGGVSSTDSTGATGSIDATARVTQIAQDVINIFSWVVGIISVIMVIVGGFQYITSGGDSGKVTTAKNTIMYALIGIIIVALSQVMVKFVLEKFVGP